MADERTPSPESSAAAEDQAEQQRKLRGVPFRAGFDPRRHVYKSGYDPARKTHGLKPFVKGDPRINREGAPRRVATRALREELTEEDLREIWRVTIEMAKKGSHEARRDIMDRLEGKPIQYQRIGGDESAVPIEVVLRWSDADDLAADDGDGGEDGQNQSSADAGANTDAGEC